METIMLKKTLQYEQLKEAMELIQELKIPEHLQEKALTHLLQGTNSQHVAAAAASEVGGSGGGMAAGGLRDLLAKHPPKGAVEEIPTLLWWAKENENVDSFSEDDIVTLYRRGGIRPPKHVAQSMRDLSSKKYLRLEAVKGKAGYVKLSRVGADFILHDLLKRKAS